MLLTNIVVTRAGWNRISVIRLVSPASLLSFSSRGVLLLPLVLLFWSALSLSLWLAGLFQGDRPPLSVRSTITGRVVLQGLPSAPAESYAARIWPLLCASSPSEERTLLVPRERHAGNLLFLASSPFTLLSDYVCFIRTRNEGASRKRLKENLIECLSSSRPVCFIMSFEL